MCTGKYLNKENFNYVLQCKLLCTIPYFSEVFVPVPKTYEIRNITYGPNIFLQMDFTLLKLLDELRQITSVIVGVVIECIRPELLKSLGAALVGSHVVCRKHYTVILNVSSLSNIDIDYHSIVNGFMFRLFELLAECSTQNSFVDRITLEFKLLNNTAYIFARLSRHFHLIANSFSAYIRRGTISKSVLCCYKFSPNSNFYTEIITTT